MLLSFPCPEGVDWRFNEDPRVTHIKEGATWSCLCSNLRKHWLSVRKVLALASQKVD